MKQRTRHLVFAVAALGVLAIVVYLSLPDAPPGPGAEPELVPRSAPVPSSLPADPPQVATASSPTQATATRSSAVDHAKVLVWKYLGEPRYDVLNITRASNTVADIWDVSGQFAYVGSTARAFDAIVEKQKGGDWWLLAFSWK